MRPVQGRRIRQRRVPAILLAGALRVTLLAVAGSVVIIFVSPAAAQAPCPSPERPRTSEVGVARDWPSPLDRRVTLPSTRGSLREGLERLAAAAGVRISYVSDLVPLDRLVCLAYESTPVGDALADLLRGTAVEPVAAGGDRVVLAPVQSDDGLRPGHPSERGSTRLQRVVVTGSATRPPDQSIPLSADVIDASELARHDAASLAHALSARVPGLWMWQRSPTSPMGQFGSIRGASSFGLTYPKIYVDGIEVANPLLFTTLDPRAVERVEVIRGPQGAALYGAGAISGVINIVTRHDPAGPRGRQLALESVAGVAESDFAREGVLSQRHALTYRAGNNPLSGGLALGLGTLGAYVPGAFSRTLSAAGDLRVVGSRFLLDGVARLQAERAGAPTSPSAVRPRPEPGTWGQYASRPMPDGQYVATPWGAVGSADASPEQSVGQYTIGTTLTVAPNDRWTHAVVLGIDGYRLANARDAWVPLAPAVDSALAAARGGADRGTIRMSSAGRLGGSHGANATLTVAAEHSAERASGTVPVATVSASGTGGPSDGFGIVERRAVRWRASTGILARGSAEFRETLFLTAGLRLDRSDGTLGTGHLSALPMLGAAVVGGRGEVTVTLRGAYGKAIRPVQDPLGRPAWLGRRPILIPIDLAPEEQAGVEAGVDVLVGRAVSIRVTRFDQRASGLVQSVAVAAPDELHGGSGSPSRDVIAYALRNVGEISNRGWEMQASAEARRLSLSGTLSLVESRVERLAPGYGGDLRPGDRMLEVPAATAGLTGTWRGDRWFASGSVARAWDWINYDRVALAGSLAAGALTPVELAGPRLREYWARYGGVTRVGFAASRELFHGVSLLVRADNLLGRQRGEPDNITIVPGRTVTLGLRAAF